MLASSGCVFTHLSYSLRTARLASSFFIAILGRHTMCARHILLDWLVEGMRVDSALHCGLGYGLQLVGVSLRIPLNF